MRTTVTIDPSLFAEADEQAKQLGFSRSRFYQTALAHFLQELREQQLTEQMNRHLTRYRESEDRGLESYVAEVWKRDMGDDEW
jgi:metal-responsive CopG/Arc/MetJ family transcriptional regulator